MFEIKIKKVDEKTMEGVLAYVKAFRKDLFPMLDHTKVPNDLLHFKSIYLDHPLGCFLQANNEKGELIGVIGMMPYDDRFDYLDYKHQRTVEVARLFVEPTYRRTGLATQLFQALIEVAKEKEIECLYLHTHPFLTGAFEYWQKQGFQHRTTSLDGGFTTWHMDRMVDSLQLATI